MIEHGEENREEYLRQTNELCEDLSRANMHGLLYTEVREIGGLWNLVTIRFLKIHIEKFTELYAYLIAKYPLISFAPEHQYMRGRADVCKVWDASIEFRLPQ